MLFLLRVIPVIELLLDLFGGECIVRVCHFTKVNFMLILKRACIKNSTDNLLGFWLIHH